MNLKIKVNYKIDTIHQICKIYANKICVQVELSINALVIFFFFSLSSHYAYNKIIIMGLHTISMHELTKLTWKLITTMGSNHYLS